jgi:hypothetical protein
MSSQIDNRGIFLLLFQPGELVREPLPRGIADVEFEQKTAGPGVADMAIELAEITENRM